MGNKLDILHNQKPFKLLLLLELSIKDMIISLNVCNTLHYTVQFATIASFPARKHSTIIRKYLPHYTIVRAQPRTI